MRGGYGLDATPAVWTSEALSGVHHETVFSGLSVSTRYTLMLHAVDPWSRVATAVLEVETAPAATRAAATADGDTILLEGRPFFPLMVWDECADSAFRQLLEGINVFMSNGCGRDSALVSALRGAAYSVTAAADGLVDRPGLIGWYYEDELDARVPGTISASELAALTPDPPDGLLSFLTLTNHFYSRAEPLPAGRAFYPAFAARTDVLGFDLYPLQNWCRDESFSDVYDAQRELDTLAGGKPTFQWIEVRLMDCHDLRLDPTPASVRAETWLAIAGGADGIGYFPNTWSERVGAEIRRLNLQIKELAPALLAEPRAAESSQAAVKVGARELAGAVYVIAVNSSLSPLEASVRVPGLGARPLALLDEARSVVSADDTIVDSFGPLGVHVYVAAPPGWD